MSNSQATSHESWLVTYFPCDPGFSQINLQQKEKKGSGAAHRNLLLLLDQVIRTHIVNSPTGNFYKANVKN